MSSIFSFGVIADVQYCDIDNGWDFHHTRERLYRDSAKVLESAVTHWNTLEPKIDFVAQLGDFVDGQCKTKLDKPREMLQYLMKTVEKSTCKKWVHLIGNHELYCFSRDELAELLNTRDADTGKEYYSFVPHPGWRVVVLDPYEIATIGVPQESESFKEARKLMIEKNPNDTTGPVDWTKGLEGTNLRFLPYNGGLGSPQLVWLQKVIQDAATNNEKVIVLSHIAVCPGACSNMCLVWNYEEILAALHNGGNSPVVAVLSGHDHPGGYVEDKLGIPHLTFYAGLECGADQPAFGTVRVFGDRIELAGSGPVPSKTWKLDKTDAKNT